MNSPRWWRWLFWILLALLLVKLYLLLFAGAIFLIWIAQWLLWLLAVVSLAAMYSLGQIVYRQASWSSLSGWLLLAVLLLMLGIATRSAKWTGEWVWRSSDGPSNSSVIALTAEGENLIPCESDGEAGVKPAPSGVTIAMFSTSYNPRSDGKKPDYTESTGYAIKELAYDKINSRHETASEPYTADEIPEGDVFFIARGDPGFSAGYDFKLQVCSVDGIMLAKESLGSGQPRSEEAAADVTAVVQYLWQNRRVWSPGQYRAYGYIFDRDNQWKLVAKSETFTIK